VLPTQPGGHRVFLKGPLVRAAARITEVFGANTGLAWLAAQPYDWARPHDRQAFANMVTERVGQLFRTRMASAALLTPGLPRAYCEAMAADIRAHGVPTDPPLYLYQPHDLARAGLIMRMPFLGYYWRRLLADGRPPCAWCGAPEGQWGHHLIRCREAPAPIRAMRDAALAAIYADLSRAARAARDGPLSAANLERLYRLDWHGHGPGRDRVRHRADAGHQPDAAALSKALWYLRTCHNAYALVAPLTAVGRPSVDPLPVHGPDPFVVIGE